MEDGLGGGGGVVCGGILGVVLFGGLSVVSRVDGCSNVVETFQWVYAVHVVVPRSVPRARPPLLPRPKGGTLQ